MFIQTMVDCIAIAVAVISIFGLLRGMNSPQRRREIKNQMYRQYGKWSSLSRQ